MKEFIVNYVAKWNTDTINVLRAKSQKKQIEIVIIY